jgi:hypothetical protein
LPAPATNWSAPFAAVNEFPPAHTSYSREGLIVDGDRFRASGSSGSSSERRYRAQVRILLSYVYR